MSKILPKALNFKRFVKNVFGNKWSNLSKELKQEAFNSYIRHAVVEFAKQEKLTINIPEDK